MLVLTWNLFHGRALPAAGSDLLDEFATALAGWEWDVALLQEVPPWWPSALAAAAGAEPRSVLTSRNAALALRRALAVRWPDLIKAHGGGANAILARPGAGKISGHRALTLARTPERRRLHAVRVNGGTWVGNLHLTVHDDARARGEAARAAAVMREWAGGAPAILGGDFNVRGLTLDGFALAAVADVDHIFAVSRPDRRFDRAEVLERGPLSDHAPVRVAIATD